MHSDYDFFKIMLYKTPDAVRPFGSRNDVVAAMMLMIVKGIAIPEDSGIFEVNTGEFLGFQYGDVQKHPKRVVVDLYSGDRGVELVFVGQDHKPLDLSQADINRVIQTLHRVDPATSQKSQS